MCRPRAIAWCTKKSPGPIVKNSDFLQIKKTGAGSVDLEFNALSGYRTSIDTTFRMIATDSQGESVSTNWINTMINPKSDQTLISTGSNNSPLSESIDNVATSKNTNIRLFEKPNLSNYIEMSVK